MSLRQKTLSGLFWSFLERFSSQIIQFIVSIILARILLPEEFGLIGMITVFIALGVTLIDSGLTTSLIRTPEAGDDDYSTVFFTNLSVSFLVYLIIYFFAPSISRFFEEPSLCTIIRVYCLGFFIKAFSAVQKTRLTAIMDFRAQMLVQIPSLLGGGLTGILLAYQGYGVWSLVWMYLAQTSMSTVQLWIRTGWRPSLVFNMEKFKYHFDFGYKMALSGIINTIYDNIYHIIIGKYFSPAVLGFYTRAQTMKQLPANNLASALNRVTYPMFTSIRESEEKLKMVYRKVMQQVLFWIAPTLIISGVLAEPLFRLLLTEKWLPSVPYFRILCIVGIMYPLHAYNLNILKVKGRSDLFLRLEIFKKILTTIGLIFAVPMGIYGLLWLQVLLNLISFFINTHYSGFLINYSLMDQMRDIGPIFCISIFAGLVALFLDLQLIEFCNFDLCRLLIGSSLGMIAYLWMSQILKISAFIDFKQILIKR